jgi:hypothetical protein
MIVLESSCDFLFANVTTLLLMNVLTYFEITRYVNEELFINEFNPAFPFKKFVESFEPQSIKGNWFSKRIFRNEKTMQEFFNFKVYTPLQLYLHDLLGQEQFALIQSATTIDQAGQIIRNKSLEYEKITAFLRTVVALLPSFPSLESKMSDFNNLKYVFLKEGIDQQFENDLAFQLYWRNYHKNIIDSLKDSEQKLAEIKKFGPEVLAMLWHTKHSFELILYGGAMNELKNNPKALQEAKEYVLNKTQEIAAKSFKNAFKNRTK